MGLKTGALTADVSGFDFDAPVGFYGGISRGAGSFEFDVVIASGHFSGLDIGFNTLAVYNAYRSEGDFYVKAKVGLLREEVSAKEDFIGDFKEVDIRASLGAGIGARFDYFSIEAEYTLIELDAHFFSVGLTLGFNRK